MQIMKKEEVIAIMLESINNDNKDICARAGMDQATINAQIEASQQSLAFMLNNVYDKLSELGLLCSH